MDNPSMEEAILAAARAGYISAILDAIQIARSQMGATAQSLKLVSALQDLADEAAARVKASYARAEMAVQ